MAVFKYIAASKSKEHDFETGTVIARDKVEAFDKLKTHNLSDIRLKQLEGISAFFYKMKADIK